MIDRWFEKSIIFLSFDFFRKNENSYPYPIVFIDNDYIIRFMNKNAQYHYKEVFVCVTTRNQRVYMQGATNEKGEWIGFIERFELNLQM